MNKINQNYDFSLLYVEDEPLIRQNAVEFLSDRFKIIYEAKDAKEALRIYVEKKPDIIITDIQMPIMNGLEFCKEIRKDDEKTPIIITTAYTDQEYLLQAVELNLVKYIVKPIDEEVLNEALELCVQKIESKNSNIVRVAKNHYFDTFNYTLLDENNLIKLTQKELKFLTLLVDQKTRIVSYKEIENYVWAGEYMSEDALKSLVRKLRKKISKQSIQNYSKLGYKINLYYG